MNNGNGGRNNTEHFVTHLLYLMVPALLWVG